jgi:hypothetical protein
MLQRITVKKEAAEHEEHLTHVLHQLQNKPWAALYVACIFFMLISMGFRFYAINKLHKQVGHQYCLELCRNYGYPPVDIIYIFSALGLFILILFIWLDPEVVAHDKLIATKSGYLNFPFDCKSRYS